MKTFLKGIFLTIFVIFVVTLFLWLPLFFLWNWLMPIIFGLPELTLLQALGLLFLSSLLFKSSSVGNKINNTIRSKL